MVLPQSNPELGRASLAPPAVPSGCIEGCSGALQPQHSSAPAVLPFDIQAARALIYCTVGGVQSVLHLPGVHALQPVLVHPLHVQVGFWQPDRNGSVHLLHLGQQGSVWFAILTLGLALAIEAPLGKK